MMKRPVLAFLFLLLAAAPFFLAQERAGSGAGGSIRGTVIDTKTAQPLNGATVALQSLQAGGEWNSATTAPDGEFSFSGLVAGRYRLTASRNGYADSSGGRSERSAALALRTGTTVSLAAGQDVDDVVLRLIPTGVISGRVTNEHDEPMPGVFVQTMKSSYRTGHREFSDARAGFTDDRGEFRIWGLTPGQYYIRATNPKRGARGPAPREIYMPMFYPGVTDPGQTQAVELHPGEELSGINLTLSPSRTVHVRGRVLTSNSAPAKGAQITLSQLAGSGGYLVEAEADAAGKFDILAVPSGAYVAVAQLTENADAGRLLMGRTTVQVGDMSLDAVDLVIFPGATVSGHVRVEGDRKVSLARTSASLRPIDSSEAEGNMGSASVQPDGTFVFRDVPEGNYRVALRPLPDGYYSRPGAAGDTADAGVLVSHGHAPPVELRLGPGAGRIQGVVYKDKNNEQAAPSATVVLVPDGKRRLNSEYYREAAADQSGNFLLGSIAPGDYSLFAWEDIEKDAYMDPDFMQQYEGAGKAVHVEEGSALSFQLQLAAQTRDSSH